VAGDLDLTNRCVARWRHAALPDNHRLYAHAIPHLWWSLFRHTASTDSIDKQTDWQADTDTIRQWHIQWKRIQFMKMNTI